MRYDDKTDLPGWLGLRRIPDLTKARWLGPLLTFGAVLIFGGLFLLALASALVVLSSAVFGSLLDDPRSALGVGGVTVALIGAPFVIWRSVVAQKTVTLQEQGHITDRINTAVLGLGEEKEVNRIGRPVTIWTGKPGTVTHQVEDAEKFMLPPRSIETRRYRDISPLGDPDGNEYHQGLHVEVKSWPEEKTIIEWQGQNIEIEQTEHLGSVGDWQPFPETQPNLEVRIGAIYALERIAQDSDRDHVQIMEILCAYIRQNAPAPAEDHWPEPELHESEEDGPLETGAGWQLRNEDFRFKQSRSINALKFREDIQISLTVIGRRSTRQRRLEAGRGVEAVFPFDVPCPVYFGPYEEHDPDGSVDYLEKLEAWKSNLKDYEGYRLDLRGANLRGSDLTKLNLKGAKLEDTYLQGARLWEARLQGADLVAARLQGARLMEAQLQGADLWEARLHGANLRGARLQGARLVEARLQGAFLGAAQLQAADFWKALLQGANLKMARLQGARLLQARLQGADLRQARLQGADLTGARLHGANLREARFDGNTLLTAATLRGAAVKAVAFTNVPQIAEHVPDMFGDASVTLPDGHGPGHKNWPAHWPKFELGDDFEEEWRAWQRDPEGYRPPDPPQPNDTA